MNLILVLIPFPTLYNLLGIILIVKKKPVGEGEGGGGRERHPEYRRIKFWEMDKKVPVIKYAKNMFLEMDPKLHRYDQITGLRRL